MPERRIFTSDRRKTVRGTQGARAEDKLAREVAKQSWEAHYKSGKRMSEWMPPKTVQRSDKYFSASNRARKVTDLPHKPAMKSARKYLKEKMYKDAIKAGTKKVAIRSALSGLSKAAGTIGTAADLGTAVIGFTRAREQERKAKLGTRMIESGMRSAKLQKELSKKSREGVSPNVKVITEPKFIKVN